jgi:hypothetical protein
MSSLCYKRQPSVLQCARQLFERSVYEKFNLPVNSSAIYTGVSMLPESQL